MEKVRKGELRRRLVLSQQLKQPLASLLSRLCRLLFTSPITTCSGRQRSCARETLSTMPVSPAPRGEFHPVAHCQGRSTLTDTPLSHSAAVL